MQGKQRTSSTPSSSSSVLPSFWNRWTRLSSSATTSPRTEAGSANGEEGVFNTPLRKSNQPNLQSPQNTEFSDDDVNSLLITPSDINRASFPEPKNANHSTPSQSSGLYSRLRPLRGGSLFSSSHNPTPESLRSIRKRREEAEEEEARRPYRGHGRESSILASFLKNNGGYMDDSESEDDEFTPPPILQRLPLTGSRLSVKPPTTTTTTTTTTTSTPSRTLNRNRSVHTPVRSAGPTTPTTMGRIQMMTPVPASKTRAELIVAEERRAWRRRSEGQALFRSLVLGEDDILRAI